MLEKKKEYQESVDQLRLLSTAFSFKDLVCEYKFDDYKQEHITKSLKEQVNAIVYKHIGSDEFKDDVIKKSSKAVKELKIESHTVFESADFDKLKKGKLELIGAFQTAKHSSHHVLSAAVLSNTFLVTGHSDSTFKIWYMTPSYFQTPFANSGIKTVAAKDLIEESFNGKKSISGTKAFELVFVSETMIFHKHYVTALCCIDRASDKRKILLSGDAGGELSLCEISYNAITAKLERVEPIFKKRAHTGQITKIERFSSDDIVVTASFDGTLIFWDIERDQKLMQMAEHEEPITSIHFIDDYNYLCSATKHDLIIWNITVEERNGNRTEIKPKEGEEMANKGIQEEPRYSLKAKIASSIDFEDKGGNFTTCKLFGTNLKNDYLLFVSVGSDIKMLNVLKGKYIGDIDGAHFKGTSNFGIMLNGGPSSRLKGTLNRIGQAFSSGNIKDALQLFVEQLNDYILLSCSSKDKLRVWKFEDGHSIPSTQISCLGGFLDSQIFAVNNRHGDLCLLVAGNCSNKIEVFSIN